MHTYSQISTSMDTVKDAVLESRLIVNLLSNSGETRWKVRADELFATNNPHPLDLVFSKGQLELFFFFDGVRKYPENDCQDWPPAIVQFDIAGQPGISFKQPQRNVVPLKISGQILQEVLSIK